MLPAACTLRRDHAMSLLDAPVYRQSSRTIAKASSMSAMKHNCGQGGDPPNHDYVHSYEIDHSVERLACSVSQQDPLGPEQS